MVIKIYVYVQTNSHNSRNCVWCCKHKHKFKTLLQLRHVLNCMCKFCSGSNKQQPRQQRSDAITVVVLLLLKKLCRSAASIVYLERTQAIKNKNKNKSKIKTEKASSHSEQLNL